MIYIIFALLFTQFCVAEHTGKFTLIAHPPNDETDVIQLSNLYIHETNNTVKVDIESLDVQENVPSDLGYCLSLLADDASDFHCFNYFKTLKIDRLTGILYINLKPHSTLIDYVTFVPKSIGGLFAELISTYKLADPKPRLAGNGNKEKLEMQKQIKEYSEFKEKENEDEEKKKQKKPNANQPVILDHNGNEDEFHEIVLPKGIYAHKKTFIERNWMYIIPPSIITIIIGNMIIGE